MLSTVLLLLSQRRLKAFVDTSSGVFVQVQDLRRWPEQQLSQKVFASSRIGFGDICPGDTNDFGKLFLVLYAFCGLGAFCGPVMDLASTWKVQLPGGWATLATFTIGLGAGIFILEGFSQGEAIYASFITGAS